MKYTLTFVLALLCVAVCCSLFIPKESRYLKVGQGQASSDEVQRQLGMPIERTSVPTGEALWRYEVLGEQPTHRGPPTGFWCDDDRLTSDAGGVLRHWTHRSFFTVENYGQSLAMPGMSDSRYDRSHEIMS